MDHISVAIPALEGPATAMSTAEAAQLLELAYKTRSNLGFVKQVLECPRIGAIYTIETSMAAQDRAFQDGYGYMDDEAVVERAVSANNREILCYERKLGFRRGEQAVSISRRRYRLAAPGVPAAAAVLQVLHYFMPREQTVPASTKQAKANPRSLQADPNFQNSFPALYPGLQPLNQGMRPPAAPGPSGGRADEIAPAVADSLDHLTMREVAFDRYRRNHEHMAEIVSPYALSEIIKPGIFQGVDTKWITSLASDDLEQLQDAAERFGRRMKTYQEAEERLKTATGAEVGDVESWLKQQLEE